MVTNKITYITSLTELIKSALNYLLTYCSIITVSNGRKYHNDIRVSVHDLRVVKWLNETW